LFPNQKITISLFLYNINWWYAICYFLFQFLICHQLIQHNSKKKKKKKGETIKKAYQNKSKLKENKILFYLNLYKIATEKKNKIREAVETLGK